MIAAKKKGDEGMMQNPHKKKIKRGNKPFWK